MMAKCWILTTAVTTAVAAALGLAEVSARGAVLRQTGTGDAASVSGHAAGGGTTMATTYTVWYRRDRGQRWHSTSGLSYYHACRLRDDYLRRGWDAFVAADR